MNGEENINHSFVKWYRRDQFCEIMEKGIIYLIDTYRVQLWRY
jgi:hypothetical protein